MKRILLTILIVLMWAMPLNAMVCLDNLDTLEGGASVDAVVDYTVHGLVGSTFTNIAQGQLSDTDPSVLYTAGAAISIVSVIYVNTHSTAVTVNLYLDPANAATPRRMIPKDLSLGIGYSMHFDGQRCTVMDANGGIVSGLNISNSADLAALLDDETGTGVAVFSTTPTLVTPVLGVATGTSYQGIIGDVTPAAGSFTTIGATGNVTPDLLTASKPVFTDASKNLVSTGTLAVDQGGTGVTSSTGTVAVVLSNTPTLVTPEIGAATGTSLDVGASTLATRSLTVDTGGVFNIDLGGAAGDDFTVDTTTFNVSSDIDRVGIGVVPTARNNTVLQIKDGIGFPATAVASTDPNTLDGYEKGEYEPTIVGSTSGSYTINTNTTLAYTKIGRQVTITGYLSIIGETAPVGELRFLIPFTVENLTENAGYSVGIARMRDHGGNIPNAIMPLVADGVLYFLLANVADNGTAQIIDKDDVDAAWDITVSLTYFGIWP